MENVWGRILTTEIADLLEGTIEDTEEEEVEETTDDTTELDLLKKEDITATILVERVFHDVIINYLCIGTRYKFVFRTKQSPFLLVRCDSKYQTIGTRRCHSDIDRGLRLANFIRHAGRGPRFAIGESHACERVKLWTVYYIIIKESPRKNTPSGAKMHRSKARKKFFSSNTVASATFPGLSLC